MHLHIKILAYQNRIDIFIENLINLSISNKKNIIMMLLVKLYSF